MSYGTEVLRLIDEGYIDRNLATLELRGSLRIQDMIQLTTLRNIDVSLRAIVNRLDHQDEHRANVAGSLDGILTVIDNVAASLNAIAKVLDDFGEGTHLHVQVDR